MQLNPKKYKPSYTIMPDYHTAYGCTLKVEIPHLVWVVIMQMLVVGLMMSVASFRMSYTETLLFGNQHFLTQKT